MLDRAVLAGRVDPLEDDQDGMFLFGPQPVLERGQPIEAASQLRRGRRLGPPVGIAGIDVRELDLLILASSGNTRPSSSVATAPESGS